MSFNKISGCFNTEFSLIDFSKSRNVFIVKIPIFDYFPLVAIRSNDLRMTIETNKIDNLLRVYTDEQNTVKVTLDIYNNNVKTSLKTILATNADSQNNKFNYQLMIDYIHLDESQLDLFMNKKLEYKIEQLNYKEVNTIYNNSLKIDLDEFINPTRQLIITIEDHNNISNNIYFKYLPIKQISLNLNNIKRKDKTAGVMVHNSSSNLNYTKHMYCIPFDLKSNDVHQHSGSYNFSETKNNFLELFLDAVYNDSKIIVKIYGPCYNLVQIQDGQFSVMFS
jgi:hypothetical protein